MVTNLVGFGVTGRCLEAMPAHTQAGEVPTVQGDGSVQWSLPGSGPGADDQTAAEVPITAIPGLPGATQVQQALAALALRPYRILVGMGGDNTAVVTGNTVTLRAPDAFTITQVRASLYAASTFGKVDIDVKKNGVTIFSTRVTIDQGEKTSVTAAVAAVLSTTAVAEDDELTIEIIDDGATASGARVAIKGTYP